ncbi:hypothetical protein [Serratia nevei]|uniref:hypothetical protein n=1 Tax=Serratia nevei TaxID=2703794 RepID=UPI00254EE985|nr:hypothetical protein [Serratia nevei]MDK5165487.1 hypothetical protein [Serratia nevei]
MPSRANPNREDITIHIGDLKKKLLKACQEVGKTPTEVVREQIRKWLSARERQRQREAKAENEIAATNAATDSTRRKGSAGGKTVRGQPSK